MSLVNADAFTEALLCLGDVVDVEVEGSVVEPVVWLVLLASNALQQTTDGEYTIQYRTRFNIQQQTSW